MGDATSSESDSLKSLDFNKLELQEIASLPQRHSELRSTCLRTPALGKENHQGPTYTTCWSQQEICTTTRNLAGRFVSAGMKQVAWLSPWDKREEIPTTWRKKLLFPKKGQMSLSVMY